MSSLFDAYRKTRYEVLTVQGVITLRHGEKSPALDVQLAGHAREWAFVTAWNPASKPLTREENDRRHRELLKVVMPRYPTLPGTGVGEGWPAEESLFIVGIPRSEAVSLGQRFGQLAIVVGSVGELAEVIACHDA